MLEKKLILETEIINRKARTPTRKLYSVIFQTKPLFILIFNFIFIIIEKKLLLADLNINNLNFDFVFLHKYLQKLLTTTERLWENFNSGSFGDSIQKFFFQNFEFFIENL
jgi:hypothetical protein